MDGSGSGQPPKEPSLRCAYCPGLCRVDCPNFRSLSPMGRLIKAAEMLEALEANENNEANAAKEAFTHSEIDDRQAIAPDRNNEPRNNEPVGSVADAEPEPNVAVMPGSSTASQPPLDALKKNR